MEKLLHERLREWTSDEGTAPVYVIALKDACGAAANDAFTALADEIERYYIPRPRFEDGEPVQFGGEVEGCNGGLKALLLFNDGSGQAYGSKDDPWEPMGGIDFAHDDLKRPTPKVYDADGVEIKVGDTVYNLENDGEQGTVRCFYSYGLGIEWSGGWRSDGVNPQYLTHEKPVFDAEGVRICKGDKVWDKDAKNPIPMKVLNFVCGEVRTDALGENSPGFMPENLTHREPDSLEKLRDDISNCNGDYVEWGSRLTALIERN